MMPRQFGDAVDSETTKFTINAHDINSHLQFNNVGQPNLSSFELNKKYDSQYEFRETILSLTRTLELHLLIFSKNNPIVYFCGLHWFLDND